MQRKHFYFFGCFVFFFANLTWIYITIDTFEIDSEEILDSDPSSFIISHKDLYPPFQRFDLPKVLHVEGRSDYIDTVLSLLLSLFPNAEIYNETLHSTADLSWIIHSEPPRSVNPPGFLNVIDGLQRTIGLKTSLLQTLRNASQKFSPNFVDFFPPCFLLPAEHNDLARSRAQDPHSMWILKPLGGYSSKGILLLFPNQRIPSGSWIAQRYLDRPLLYRGFKFDFRVYVLIASVEPLVIYYYPIGVPRVATVPFRDDRKEAGAEAADLTVFESGQRSSKYPTANKCMHLTDPTFQQSKCAGAREVLEGIPTDTETFRLSFVTEHGIDLTPAMNMMWENILRTTLLGVIQVLPIGGKQQSDTKKHFQLLGFDVIFEESFAGTIRPQILEVNLNPNLHEDDRHPLVSNLVQSLFSVIGVIPRREEYFYADFLQRLHGAGVCDLRRWTPDPPETVELGRRQRLETADFLKSRCSIDVLSSLRDAFIDFQYRGGFGLLFPTSTSIRLYGQEFFSPLYRRSVADATLHDWVLAESPFF